MAAGGEVVNPGRTEGRNAPGFRNPSPSSPGTLVDIGPLYQNYIAQGCSHPLPLCVGMSTRICPSGAEMAPVGTCKAAAASGCHQHLPMVLLSSRDLVAERLMHMSWWLFSSPGSTDT